MRRWKYRVAESLGYYMFRKRPLQGPFPEALYHAVSICQKFKVKGFVDVGAHHGETGLDLRHLGYQGWIFSFEPNPKCFEQLNLAAQGDPKWKVYNFALSEKAETRTFYAQGDSTLGSLSKGSSFGKKVFEKDLESPEEFQVTTRPLDVFWTEIVEMSQSSSFFLKMDTQGHDLQVLKGASKTLESVCGLISEISVIPVYEEATHYLENLKKYSDCGFLPAAFYPITWHESGQLSLEMDVVMVKSTALS